MNTGHRTVPGLLAIIAALLALNLIVKGTPQAWAGSPAGQSGEPYIVKLLPVTRLQHLRVWPDGRVDNMTRTAGNCDYGIEGTNSSPVEHPFPVVDAVLGSNHDVQAMMIEYADGRVDLIGQGERCTIAGIGTPSLCTADVDRDGEIGTADLLELLNQWGPCK